MKKEILYPIITAVVVGALAFFGGMQFQKSQRVTVSGNGQGNSMMQGGGQRGGGAGAQGGQRIMNSGSRPVMGEIISADDEQSSSSIKSITVKMEDGSSKIVLISDTTAINRTDPGAKTDLTVGTRVGVFGADNNGTVTAQNIQINPQQMRIGTSSASPK